MSVLDRHLREVKHTTRCCISFSSLNPSNWSIGGTSVGQAVQSVGNAVETAGQQAVNAVKAGVSAIRDPLESAAVVALNYYLPGSSMLTEHLVSQGSQAELSSRYGAAALMLSAGSGLYEGNGGNYGKLLNSGENAIGMSTPAGGMGTMATSGLTADGTPAVASGTGAGTAAAAPPSAPPAPTGLSPTSTLAASTLASMYLAPKQSPLPQPPNAIPPPQPMQSPTATDFVNQMTGTGQSGGYGGYGSTLLTGGVDPNSLKTVKSTLMGA